VSQDLTGAAREALLLAFHTEHVVQEDLLDARLLLEPHIAALAASSASSVQSRRLLEMRRLMEQIHDAHAAGDLARATELWGRSDAQLHILLAEMSQNPVYKILIEVIDGILWRHQGAGPGLSDENLREATGQHLAICDAVLAGDPEAARAAMLTHLQYTRSHITGGGRVMMP
jgi:DNA-binding FadR family transcriptional regulator